MEAERQQPEKIAVRGLDAALWERVRIEAVRRKVPACRIVNEALGGWLDQYEGRK